MGEIVINSSDTDPEAYAVFEAAVRAYANWCREHDLAIVPAAALKVDPGESWTLYDAYGGPLKHGDVEELRRNLGI